MATKPQFQFDPAEAETYKSTTVLKGIDSIKDLSKGLMTEEAGGARGVKKLTDYSSWWTGDAADGFKVLLKNANTAIGNVLDKLYEDLEGIIRKQTEDYQAFEAAQKTRHESTNWS